MERGRIFWSKSALFFVTFLLAFAIMSLAFALLGVFPFGDHQILVIDAYHQYYPFLSEYRDALVSGRSLIYNSDIGMGVNFYLLNLYYNNSPLNLLTALVPHAFLREYMLFATVAKIAFAAACMAVLLRYLSTVYRPDAGRRTDAELGSGAGRKSIAEPRSDVGSGSNTEPRSDAGLDAVRGLDIGSSLFPVTFGLLYAFSAFFMGYYWCIMWLDGVALLPLIVLGLHKLLRNESPALYVISLAIAVIANYYIGYMICLFLILYYFYLWFTGTGDGVSHERRNTEFLLSGTGNKPTFLRQSVRVLGYSLLSMALSAFVLIPAIFGMRLASSAAVTLPESFAWKHGLLSLFERLFTGAETTTFENGKLPNIASGTLSIYLGFLFFRASDIRRSEKFAALVMLAIFVLGYTTNIGTLIWHGFRFPHGIPHRFSFASIFFFLLLGYRAVHSWHRLQSRDVLLFMTAILIYLFYALGNRMMVHTAMIGMVTMLLFGVVLTWALRAKSKQKMGLFGGVLLAMVIVESFFSALLGIAYTGVTNREDYLAHETELHAALEGLEMPETEGFRVEMAKPYTANDPALYGYRGASIFSSTVNAGVSAFVHELGGTGGRDHNYYHLPISAPILDSLFGVRYYIAREESWKSGALGESGEPRDRQDSGFKLLKNEHVLPLGFYVSPQVMDYKGDSPNPFVCQEELYSCFLGSEVRVYSERIRPTVVYENAQELEYVDSEGRYRYAVKDKSKDAGIQIEHTFLESGDYHLYCAAPDAEKGVLRLARKEDEGAGGKNESGHQDDGSANGLANAIDQATNDKNENENDPDCSGGWLYQEQCYEVRGGAGISLGRVDAGDRLAFELLLSQRLMTADADADGCGKDVFKLWLVRSSSDAFVPAYERIAKHTLKMTKMEDRTLKGRIRAPQDGYLFVSVPYEPGWSAMINGSPVSIEPLKQAMMLIPVQSGDNHVVLTYAPEGLAEGVVISALAWIVASVVLWYFRTMRRAHR